MLHLSRAKTTVPFNTNFPTSDYFCEIKRIANMDAIGSRGSSPHVGEICNVLVVVCAFFFFLHR